jgi:hypothetical protein
MYGILLPYLCSPIPVSFKQRKNCHIQLNTAPLLCECKQSGNDIMGDSTSCQPGPLENADAAELKALLEQSQDYLNEHQQVGLEGGIIIRCCIRWLPAEYLGQVVAVVY